MLCKQKINDGKFRYHLAWIRSDSKVNMKIFILSFIILLWGFGNKSITHDPETKRFHV